MSCAAGLLALALTAFPVQAQATPTRTVSTQIARWAAWTQRELMDARQERDVVLVLCLDDRLNELHALERSASVHEARLLASGVPRQARQARIALLLNYAQARTVRRQASQCRGAAPYRGSGTTQVRFWIDPRVTPYEPRYEQTQR